MSKSPPSAGSPPPAVDPALLGRHEAGLRTYLAGLQGASATQVDGVIREIMREAPANAAFEDDPVVWMFAQGRRRIGTGGQRGDVLAGESGDDEPVTGEDPAIAVHRAFGRLTNKQQEMLRLKFQFGFNLAELARITGVSQSGASGLLHAAVERICRAAGAALSLGAGRGGDVRLTAYALDEMEPAEKQAFAESVPDRKALLESSDAIRKVGQQLTRVLESGAPLAKRQRRRTSTAWWQSRGLRVAGAIVAVLVALAWYFLGRSGEIKSTRGPVATAVSDEAATPARTRDAGAGAARSAASTPGNSTPSGRALRPGEAAWERKPFGQGHGAPGGAAGEAGGEASDNPAPAVAGGNTGPLGAGSGPGAPADSHAPAPEDQELNNESDPTKNPGTDTPDPVDGAGPLLAGGGETGGAALPISSTQSVPMREMPPAKPDQKDATTQAPVSPKEASKIPPKHPQLADFTPLSRELRTRPLRKPTAARAGEMLRHVPPDTTPPNATDAPVTTRLEVTPSPWKPDKQIVRATVKARATRVPSRPPVNLVFAIDVSGSMAGSNRLPLVQEGIRLLAERLRAEDRVAVVTYAAQAKVVLPGNPLGEKALELRNCLTALETSGQTNGYEGLLLAYDTARQNRVEVGLNVVVLCTDGNFNLGQTDGNALAALATQASADGIKLSVFGFGRSDRNDLRLELLATQGGGRSCYVNTSEEAERLLSGQIDGLVEMVAREVTLEVTFDRDRVGEIARIDGGKDSVRELLSGRSLSALYEVGIKPGAKNTERLAELLVAYRLAGSTAPGHMTAEWDGVVRDWNRLDAGFRFAIAWSEFGRIVQEDGNDAGNDLNRLEAWVQRYLPDDAGGYRRELLENVAAARVP